MTVAPRPRWILTLTGLLFELCLGLAAMFAGWLIGRPPTASLSWNGSGLVWGCVAAFPMLLALATGLRWPIGPLQDIMNFCDTVLSPLFSPCSLLDFALISLAAGFGEELLFRGFLQSLFSDWLGVPAGLLLAALLFGLFHPITPGYVLLAAFMGGYLGLVWLLQGNLLTVIVAHAVYDWAALIYLVRIRRPALE